MSTIGTFSDSKFRDKIIDIDIRGIKELQDFMIQFPIQAMKVIKDEQYKLVIDIRNDILKSMRNTHKAGRWYRTNSKFSEKTGKIKKGIFHQASAPGFPPAIRSGNLANRIFPERGEGYSRLYTDNVKYAIYLEEGTIKMEARPFFEPAVERSNWQNRIRNRIIAERFAGRKLE